VSNQAGFSIFWARFPATAEVLASAAHIRVLSPDSLSPSSPSVIKNFSGSLSNSGTAVRRYSEGKAAVARRAPIEARQVGQRVPIDWPRVYVTEDLVEQNPVFARRSVWVLISAETGN
jgi:hypothetical protein